MLPDFPRGRPPRPWPAVALVLVGALLVGCGGGSIASFVPSSTCGADGRAAGAYPELEARLPASFHAAPPVSVDSGRHCSEAALGSLITHHASNVQFAGAVWDLGGGTAISSAIFRLPGNDLPADWIAEFYDIGARTAKRTGNIETSSPTVPGAGQAFRLDTLNDLSLQTVLVWQDGPLVRVVLVATPVSPGASVRAHDELVDAAVAVTVEAEGP